MEHASNRLMAAFMAFLLAVAFVPLAPSQAVADDELEPAATEDSAIPYISVGDGLTPDSTAITVYIGDLPEGAIVAVAHFDEGDDIAYNSQKNIRIMNAYTGAPSNGVNTISISKGTLKAGQKVVAFIMTGYTAADVVATSEAVVVSAKEEPSVTRADIINACSVSMESPHTDGDAAGKFKLSDTEATVSYTLHDSIESAVLSVYAYPKVARFSPDNSAYNKSLFRVQLRGGSESVASPVTASFGDKLSALDTSYDLVAYLYFRVPGVNGTSDGDYQYVVSQSFTVVDEDGQTTEPFSYPKASIVEDELTAGSTAMYVSLKGDERLFKLAEDTQNNALSDRFTIHFLVVEYDAEVESFDLDTDGYGYTTLYSEEATSEFFNKEIELKEPLTEGKKVRALCYWTQYTGSSSAIPVPKGVDYANKDYEAVVVTEGEPVSPTPKEDTPSDSPEPPNTDDQISITSAVSSSSDKVTVHVTDAPEGSAVLVKSFALGTTEFKTDKGTPHGYNINVQEGDNEFLLQFPLGPLQDGYLVAFLMNAGSVVAQSQPVAISYTAAEPQVSITLDSNDVALTQGDRFLSMFWQVDPSTTNASYKVYQYTGDTLDESAAEVVGQGSLVTSKSNYKGTTRVSIGGGSGLKANAKLQVVLTADKQKAYSNVMTVGVTPDWAMVVPTITFDQNAVKADAKTVKLVVNYPEEYVTELGNQFFCNVSVYQYPGSYTDEGFEDNELDEKPDIAQVVAGRNAEHGKTNGAIELTFGENVTLTPGSRLIAKVRLPQAERQDSDSMWEDYLSWSIPVIAADAEEPTETVWLYNLGPDTEKGAKLRKIIQGLGLTVGELTANQLNESVGYIIGRDGYASAAEPFKGEAPDTEFMLMDGLSEASLDRLLASCKEAGVSVGAKGITTDTNVVWPLHQLIDDISNEHELMTTWDKLSSLTKEAKQLDSADYNMSNDEWLGLQSVIDEAEKALTLDEDSAGGEDKLLDAYKTALSDLQSALKTAEAAKKSSRNVDPAPGETKGDKPANEDKPGESKSSEESAQDKPASSSENANPAMEETSESPAVITRGANSNAVDSNAASTPATGDALELPAGLAAIAAVFSAGALAILRRRMCD